MVRTNNKLHPKWTWWRRTAAGARAALGRILAKSPDNMAISPPRMLDCVELEDRVLFSAAPLAMVIAPRGAASGPEQVHPLGPQAGQTAQRSAKLAATAIQCMSGADVAAGAATTGSAVSALANEIG